MRNEVFVLGSMQMLVCGLLLGVVFGAALRHLAGMGWQAAVLCGLSLALSSTAVALRLLEERGLTRMPLGRSALGLLLFQDMAAIPMLLAAGLLGSDGHLGAIVQGGADRRGWWPWPIGCGCWAGRPRRS